MRIETERLALRRWQPTDVDGLAAMYADPAIVGWLGPLTRDDASVTVERYEHHWEIHGFGRFAVEDRQSGSLVGRVGVMRQPDWTASREQDEVGWVVRPERWGEASRQKRRPPRSRTCSTGSGWSASSAGRLRTTSRRAG